MTTTYFIEIGKFIAQADNSLELFKLIQSAADLKMLSVEDTLKLTNMACKVVSTDTCESQHKHYKVWRLTTRE